MSWLPTQPQRCFLDPQLEASCKNYSLGGPEGMHKLRIAIWEQTAAAASARTENRIGQSMIFFQEESRLLDSFESLS
jgi:hypothetical protein